METVPTDFNKRIYQGVRVKHTVKDLLAEKRSRQTTGSRLNPGVIKMIMSRDSYSTVPGEGPYVCADRETLTRVPAADTRARLTSLTADKPWRFKPPGLRKMPLGYLSIAGSANVSQTPFVQMSSSPVLPGYYGVRRSFLPESEFHAAKQYSNDIYSSALGSKSIGCDPASNLSYPPLLDPYFTDSIGDYRGTSITSASGSLFSASSLPPLLPHFSGDPSHYLLKDSWEQTVPDPINQLDALCTDTSQAVSSSTNCLASENGAVHYRSANRGSSSTQGTPSYSLHALEDVHYSTSFPATSSYAFSPFMTVTNELTPKMVHHLSPEDTTETNSLQDNSAWPKDDANTVWGPYELRRNY